MTNTLYTHATPLSDLDADLANQYREVHKKKAEIERRLMDLYNKSEAAKTAQAIRKHVKPFGASGPAMDSAKFVGNTIVQELNDTSPHTIRNYMGPKTVNQLLGGKLLTDDQKRALLRQEFPQLAEVLGDAGE